MSMLPVRCRWRPTLIALALLVILPRARPQDFVEAESLPVGLHPSFSLVADLDEDGDGDIVVSNQNTNTLSLLLGDGAGGFVTSSLAAGGDPQDFDVADMNGDGRLDLVGTNGVIPTAAVLLGDGLGGFASPKTFPTGPLPFTYPKGMAVADFDEDGHADVVATNMSACNISVLIGTGDGNLLPATIVPVIQLLCDLMGTSMEDVATPDLDGDGHFDLVICDSNWGIVEVMRGTGAGKFLPATMHDVYPPWDAEPMTVLAADLNGDTHPDLVTANRKTDTASVLLNDGTGSFASVLQYGSGDFNDAALGQLDGDGVLDLALADADGDSVAVLLGDGTGAFGTQTQYVAGGWPRGVAIGELDGQGAMDIIVANSSTNDLSLLRSDGQGGFVAAINWPTGAGRDLAIGDVDGDMHLDLVTVYGGDDVWVLRGDGTGGFLPGTVHHVGGPFDYLSVSGVGIAEVDGDGNPDLVTSDLDDNGVAVLFGDGLGGFAQGPPFFVDDRPWVLATGLLDADGDVDVVTANDLDDSVCVLLGDGAGGFVLQPSYATGHRPRGVALADLDDDGALDVVTANSFVDTVTVRHGDGAGAFGPLLHVVAGTGTYVNPYDVVAGDFDLDGRLDLAAANHGGMSVGVLLGDGADFAPVTEWPTSWQASGLVVSDLDGDGAPDLAVADEEPVNGRATVLRGDGLGGFAPPLLFRTGPGPRGIVVGDLDEDGRPDLVTGNTSSGVTALLNDGLFNVAGWADLGGAKAGAAGVPALAATGSLESDATVGDDRNTLHLQHAPAHTPTVLVFGSAFLGAAFKGGTMVPDPLLFLLCITDSAGHVVIPYELPATMPSGVTLLFQFWISDSVASYGLSASNAVSGKSS